VNLPDASIRLAPPPWRPVVWHVAELAFVALIAAWVLLANLGGYPLFDVDEGAFAEASREMVATGAYAFPTLDGAPRYDKPILIYWLQAAAIASIGPSEWAVRLPSALAALAWVLATWHFARHRFGRDTALIAALMLATALGPWAIGRAATADALLNLWLALTAFDLWRHFEANRRLPLIRAYLWMALGVLTKGPVAILIPGAAALLYCWSRGAWRRPWQLLSEPVGWFLFAAIVLPWYGYALAQEGMGFIEGFFLKHNLQRFADSRDGHSGPWWYYLAALPLLFAPWSLLLPRALANLRMDWRVALRRYLWGWFAFVLLFFSLAQTKLPHYLIYGMTPLVLLAAAHLRAASPRWWASVPLFAALVLVGAAALPPLVALMSHGSTFSAFHQAIASGALAAWHADDWVSAAAALLLIATAWWGKRTYSLPIAAALSAALLAHWAAFRLLPWAGEVFQQPIVAAALASREATVVNIGLRAPSFSFYRQGITQKRPPQPGEWFVTRIDRLPDFPYTVRFQSRGVVIGERLP